MLVHEQNTFASTFSITPAEATSEGFSKLPLSRGSTSARAMAFHVTRLTTLAAVILASSTPTALTALQDFSASRAVFRPASMTVSLGAHLKEAHDEMLSFLELEPGWDGNGSVAPPEQSVLQAISFLRALPSDVPAPEATVSSDGSVGWFWKTENVFGSVEFLSSSVAAFYAEDKLTRRTSRGVFKNGAIVVPEDLIEILRAA